MTKKYRLIIIIALTVFIFFPFLSRAEGDAPKFNLPVPTAPSFSKSASTATVETIAPPTLNIPIPTLPSLSKATVTTNDKGEPQAIDIPWLAEYLLAIYKYALIIGAVFATLLLIIGGFAYMLSGLNKSWVEKSKKMILGSISGLIILLSAYLILYIINPELTKLKSFNVELVKRLTIDDILFGKDESANSDGTCGAGHVSVLKHCGIQTNSTSIPPGNFEQTFRNFAACGNFNWKILMGIADYESSFQPYVINCSCFGGLFQFKKSSIEGTFGGAGEMDYYFSGLGLATGELVENDPRLFDINLQTAGITKALLSAKEKIETICKDMTKLSDSDMATLLYLYHNSGTGTLGRTLASGACAGGTAIETGVTNAWADIFKERCAKQIKEGTKPCNVYGTFENESAAYAAGLIFGEGKANSVRKAGKERILDKYGAANLFQAEPGGSCPVAIK